MPRIQLDWQLTGDDRLSILTTLRIFGAHLGERDAGRFRLDIAGYHDSDPGPGGDVDFAVNTGSHHIGTARMSTDPADGVVDADCKVHSVANLYIGGSGVPHLRREHSDAHDRGARAALSPTTSTRSADRARDGSGHARLVAEPVEGEAEALVERGPRLPAEVDRGATGIERGAFELARHARARGRAARRSRRARPSRRRARARWSRRRCRCSSAARRPSRWRARTRRRRRRRTRSRASGAPSPNTVGWRPASMPPGEDRDDPRLAVGVLPRAVDVARARARCTRARAPRGSSAGSRRPPSSTRRTARSGAADGSRAPAAIVGDAVERAPRPREHHLAGAGGDRGLAHVERPEHVDLGVEQRLRHRHPHVELRGEVEDHLGTAVTDEVGELRRADVEPVEAELAAALRRAPR